MRVKTVVAGQRSSNSRPKPPTRTEVPAKEKRRPVPRDLDWHNLPSGTIVGLRDANFKVIDHGDRRVVRSKGGKYALLRVKRTDTGGSLGQAAGNSPFGATDALRDVSRTAPRRVDRALRKLAGGSSIDVFVMTMESIGADLERAAKLKKATTPRGKTSRIPSGLIFNPEELSMSVRATSAGLPSLGKRRR